MAYINISALFDGKVTSACFEIDNPTAARLEEALRKSPGLMAGESILTICQHLGNLMEVRHIPNGEMVRRMNPPEKITDPAVPVSPGPETKPAWTTGDIIKAAMDAHEANRLYCISIGDSSQVMWIQAPDWQRESAINGVNFAVAAGFPPPEKMHENWLAEKVAAGWVYGENKDPEAKTHPCILPYDQLPEAQRHKDTLFRDTIMQSLGVPRW